jgi:hypothetical protein
MAPIDPASWVPVAYLAIDYKRVEALCKAIKTKLSVIDRNVTVRSADMALCLFVAVARKLTAWVTRGPLASAQRHAVPSQTIAALGAATATSLGGGR